MNLVWKQAPYDGGALLVLLALADFADDDGYCFPAVPTIAKKVRLGERQTRNVIRQLLGDGVITVDRGGGRHKVSRYHIELDLLTLQPITVKPDLGKPQNPAICDTQTLQPTSANPAICDIAIRKNHQEPSAKNRKRATLISDSFVVTDQHREFARLSGLPDPDVEVARFRDYYLSRGKPMRNWDAAFRNWLRKAKELANGHRRPNGHALPTANDYQRSAAEWNGGSNAD